MKAIGKRLHSTIKVGKYTVQLKDFIKAVLDNTEGDITFNIQDAKYDAKVKFTVSHY